jgi:hypothetical protein
MRNFLRTAFLLILAYLALIHFTGFSKDISTVLGGGSEVIRTFQGR